MQNATMDAVSFMFAEEQLTRERQWFGRKKLAYEVRQRGQHLDMISFSKNNSFPGESLHLICSPRICSIHLYASDVISAVASACKNCVLARCTYESYTISQLASLVKPFQLRYNSVEILPLLKEAKVFVLHRSYVIKCLRTYTK